MLSTSYQPCQNKRMLLTQSIKELVREAIHHTETISDGSVWLWLKDSDDYLLSINLYNLLIF